MCMYMYVCVEVKVIGLLVVNSVLVGPGLLERDGSNLLAFPFRSQVLKKSLIFPLRSPLLFSI